MRFFLILSNLFLFTICFSQNNFDLKTIYKKANNNNFKLENFTFKYDKDQGTFLKIDNDLNIETRYYVEYYDSAYTSDGNNFVISFMTDVTKFNQYSHKDNFIGMFTLLYDKKNGNLLGVKINPINVVENGHSTKEEFYLTEIGKVEIIKKL